MGQGFLKRWSDRATERPEPPEQSTRRAQPEESPTLTWQLAALDEALRAFGRQLEQAATSGLTGGSPMDAHPPTEAEEAALGRLAEAQDAYQEALGRAATARLDRETEREAVFAELKRAREALGLHDAARARSARLAAWIQPLREAFSACRPPDGDPHAEAELSKAETALTEAAAAAGSASAESEQRVARAVGDAQAALARIGTRRVDGSESAALAGALRERLDLARADIAASYDGVDTPAELLDGLRLVEQQLRRATQAGSVTLPGPRLPAVREAVSEADAVLTSLDTRRKALLRERAERESAAQEAAHAREAEQRQRRRLRREREAEDRRRAVAREAAELAQAAEDREERARVRLEREAQQRTRQLLAAVATFETELTSVRPSGAECEADPVFAAQFRAAEAALQIAAANARGVEEERQTRAAEALHLARSELDALPGIRRETPELAAAIKDFRTRLADARSAGPQEDEAVLAGLHDARRALDEARSALRTPGAHRPARVFGAIGAGRAALVRLAALRAGEPVPLELATPDELARPDWQRHHGRTADPFRFRGTGPTELLVDRPEPGRPTLVEFAVRPPAKGQSIFDDRSHLEFVNRTAAATESFSGKDLTGPVQGVFLLPVGVTHLQIKCAAKATWSLRLAPTAEAPVVGADSVRGEGPAVLRCPDSGARLLRAQALTEDDHSYVGYLDAAGERRPPRFGGLLGGLAADLVANGRGEARGELWVQGPGLVVVETVGRWEVSTTAEGSAPKAARPKAPTAELHREIRELVVNRPLAWELMALRLYQARTGVGRMHGAPYLRAVINEVYLAAEAAREQEQTQEP